MTKFGPALLSIFAFVLLVSACSGDSQSPPGTARAAVTGVTGPATPTSDPDSLLVEKALKDGSLEVANPIDADRYFIGVDETTAQTLLADAEARGDPKILLPFDPSGERVSIAGRGFYSLDGHKFSNAIVAVDSLSRDTVISSPIAGQAYIVESVDRNKVAVERDVVVSTNGMGNVTSGYMFTVHASPQLTKLPPFSTEQVAFDNPVRLGSPLALTSPDMTVTLPGPFTNNFVVYIQSFPKQNPAFTNGEDTLSFLLTYNGKIVYIPQVAK